MSNSIVNFVAKPSFFGQKVLIGDTSRESKQAFKRLPQQDIIYIDY
ncbi:hypothetical protein DOK67_0002118 [Enterococcus sp. DIV0212c]|nr:hypothetical protein [Enterococcus sp. DIV0212c]MBO1355218.1 hypothetical protein [Enterococcus sp. DIV0212c]